MLAKMIQSGKLSGACQVSDMNYCSLCSICIDVSPGHTCHKMAIDGPAMSFRFLHLSLYKDASAFFAQIVEALIKSNAPGPVQRNESEETCTFAVGMLPIDSSSTMLAKMITKIVLVNESWYFGFFISQIARTKVSDSVMGNVENSIFHVSGNFEERMQKKKNSDHHIMLQTKHSSPSLEAQDLCVWVWWCAVSCVVVSVVTR